MNIRVPKNLSAFTLIETLVVLAIIGITTTIILVGWNSNRTIQYVESSAREVEGVVRSAQNYALTGTQGVVATQPCGFRFLWGGSTYSIVYSYKDGAGTCNQTSTLASYALANGVVFGSTSNFNFSLPHATIVGNQTIPLMKSGVRQVVCVYTSGHITHTVGAVCP